MNFRLYKRTRAQGKGAISVNVCLTKDPIDYSWKIQDEFVKQRDKFGNNWNYWSYIAPGLDRKKAIQQIKTAIQLYQKDLLYQ